MRVDLSAYPPDHHVLRDLRMVVGHRADARESVAAMPISDAMRTPQGNLRLGLLAILVDAVSGGLAAIAAQPDSWIATADLTLHALAPITADEVEITAHVRRRGRTTVVIDAEGPGVYSTLTFSLLPRRDSNPLIVADGDDPGAPKPLMSHSDGFSEPAYDAFRFTPRGPHAVEMPVADYVRNSLGGTQGGVLAALCDAVTAHAAGDGFETVDLQLWYLSLARTGPIVATATLDERATDYTTCDVEVLDEGGERRTTMARTTAVRW